MVFFTLYDFQFKIMYLPLTLSALTRLPARSFSLLLVLPSLYSPEEAAFLSFYGLFVGDFLHEFCFYHINSPEPLVPVECAVPVRQHTR